MIFFNCTATVQENYNYMNKYFYPEYANIRAMDEDFYKFNICNATFLDDGKYYLPIQINDITEKEVIMKLYENEKFFGKEENKILDGIIKGNLVTPQSNFFDYYD